MQVTEQTQKMLHEKLPIDDDENILAIYKHHWFAYAVNWIFGGFIVIIIMTLAIVFTSLGSSDSAMAGHKAQIIGGAAVFSIFILLGTMLPVYLRSREQVVLTEEALLQMLQPSLFASKVDQLNLQHIADVSVKQDFFGTMLGYGHITVETPGEQDNYEFSMLPQPHQVAKEIISAHENYDAALNAGRLKTTLGEAPAQQVGPQLDMEQYQQFLQYQQMLAQQQAGQTQTPITQPLTPVSADDTQVQAPVEATQAPMPNPLPPVAQPTYPPDASAAPVNQPLDNQNQ